MSFLQKDLRSVIQKHLMAFRYKVNSRFSSFVMKLFCNLAGIKLGNNVRFWGISTVVRAPFSAIVIGSNCKFRSKTTSNLIGINHRCIISTNTPNAQLIIGDGCGFSGTVIGTFSKIELGRNVRCGANTIITDSDWHPHDTRVGPAKPIYICDNVWLGYGSIVMKGVTIGENSVIGAGSIVTKNIPANVIAAGNPCKVLKQL